MASAKKQKSEPQVCRNVNKNPGKIRGWKPSAPEGPQTKKRHQNEAGKAGKNDPGPQTIWDKSQLEIATGFVFENSFLQLFVKA